MCLLGDFITSFPELSFIEPGKPASNTDPPSIGEVLDMALLVALHYISDDSTEFSKDEAVEGGAP
jgi:hypothetical protein